MKHDSVKILKEQICYQGFLTLKEIELQHGLFKGGWSQAIKRELLVRTRAAAVLPYDPVLDQVVLIEQFRIGALADTNPWLIEIVAGLVKPDESPENLAHREAKEEANLTLFELLPICEYWVSPGGTNEQVSLFCGRVDASHANGIYGLAEEHEDIRVFSLSSQEAFEWVSNGKINNSAAIIALQWLQINQQRLQSLWSK